MAALAILSSRHLMVNWLGGNQFLPWNLTVPGKHACRQTLSKLLVRERLNISGKRWSLHRHLAFVRQGSPTWDDDAKKSLSGLTQVKHKP